MDKSSFDSYVERRIVNEYEDDLRGYLGAHGFGGKSNMAKWAREAITQANDREINKRGMDVVLGIALVRACENSYAFADGQIALSQEERTHLRAERLTGDIHQIAIWLASRFRTGWPWRRRSLRTVEEYEQLLTELNEQWDSPLSVPD